MQFIIFSLQFFVHPNFTSSIYQFLYPNPETSGLNPNLSLLYFLYAMRLSPS